MKDSSVLIVSYIHPDFYPPTLNAINCLSIMFKNISIITRNQTQSTWIYPSNVEMTSLGKYQTREESMKVSILKKFFSFIIFLFNTFKKIKSSSPKLIIAYDPISLFTIYIVKIFIPSSTKLWYHNHDVGEIDKVRKFSIGWFALKFESNMFNHLDIFSLPAIERKEYFQMNELKGQFFYLPNFPSKKLYSKFYTTKSEVISPIKMIFQGSIGAGHGLGEIISILNDIIENKGIHLILKGFISDYYKNYLISLAETYNVKDKLFFYGISSYASVPELASTCHIGIGIHTKTDIMNKTLGTSSNKIYEYAAVGLPVLLYDNDHFRNHLEKYEWAFFTDLTKNSLINCIKSIISNYEYLSNSAHKSFEDKLNYEHFFKPLSDHLKAIC